MLDALSSMSYTLLALWVLFSASCALSFFLGLILVFHWVRYAYNIVMSGIATTLYCVVSILLLSSMFAAIASLS